MKFIRFQKINKVISVLVAVFMLAGLALVVSPVYASAQTLGGTASNGNLRITVNDDGSMLVERYVKVLGSGSWVKQTYVDGSTYSKGSNLRVDGTAYNLGYYGGNPATPVSNTLAGNQITTEWTVGGLDVVQKVAYNDGDNYYRLEWDVSNPTETAVSDLRFFHGEDTNLGGMTTAGGEWASGSNTILAKRTILTEQVIALQGVTAPDQYESRKYSDVASDVAAGDLVNTVDSGSLVNNGYALEWKQDSLGAGETWTIVAFEKFDRTVHGAALASAPDASTCHAGVSCDLTFTLNNPTSAATADLTLSIDGDQNTWSPTITNPDPSGTVSVAANSSVDVTVSITLPGDTENDAVGNFTLTATDSLGSTQATAKVTAVAPVISQGSPIDVEMDEDGSIANDDVTLDASDSGYTTLTWSISSAASNGDASVDPGTGDSTSVNYAPDADYNGTDSFAVKVVDDLGGEDSITVNVKINPVNDAPSDIALSNSSVEENQAAGASVGTLSSTDVDSADFTYSLEDSNADCSSTDNASFSISSDELSTAEVFNYEDKDSYTICVRTTDGDGGTYDESFTIDVTDANDAPALASSLDDQTVSVYQEFSFTLSGTAFTDEDGDTLTYTATLDDDSALPGWLSFDADTLTFSGTATETQTLSVKVTATDPDSASAEDTFTLTVEVGTTHWVISDMPDKIVVNQVMGPVAVQLVDGDGNVLTAYNGPVEIWLHQGSITPASVSKLITPLKGTTTVDAVNGEATFTNLWIDQVGSDYRFKALIKDLGGSYSDPFSVWQIHWFPLIFQNGSLW